MNSYYSFFHSHLSETFLGLSSTGWVALGTMVAFSAIIVALFGDKIKGLIFKPKLTFFSTIPIPQMKGQIHYVMHRIMVKNMGRAAAKDVRASIISLPLPVPLNWTHLDCDTRDISQDEAVYLDIIQEIDNQYIFYGWRDKLIDLPEYTLSKDRETEMKIAFFEKNMALQTVILKLDPMRRVLEVMRGSSLSDKIKITNESIKNIKDRPNGVDSDIRWSVLCSEDEK